MGSEFSCVSFPGIKVIVPVWLVVPEDDDVKAVWWTAYSF